jgi:nucleoside-diphosphate-sugar epimerase
MAQTLAFLGASSQIARDLICAMVSVGRRDLLLYARDLPAMQNWIELRGLGHAVTVHPYKAYDLLPHDAVLNFVGVGDPRRLAEMGRTIFDLTQEFDDLALAGLSRHPQRRYIFMSSGAVFGHAYQTPVTRDSMSIIPVNAITARDWYAVAKLHAEVRHRARQESAIVDLRVYNYFSRSQDLHARFFMSEILRAIQANEILSVSADPMVRDFLHPSDFHQLVECVLASPPANEAIDCYTRAPVDKAKLLNTMQEHFGLRYVTAASNRPALQATGAKPFYYSQNFRAAHYGYHPQYSSIDGVLEEAAALLT